MKLRKLLFMLAAVGVLSFAMPSSTVASRYFMIGQDQWQDALDPNEGKITGMDPYDWEKYMQLWQDPNEGNPYPDTNYYSPELYVYEPCEPTCRMDFIVDGIINFRDFAVFASHWLRTCEECYSYPVVQGLVMAWGPSQQEPNNSTSSAWVFNYGYDPDLTNTTVEITVEPSGGVNAVSFGFKDVNGKIMAWYWDCGDKGSGKPVIRNQRNPLSINTAVSGIAAATPGASGFVEDNGFNIANVKSLMADENNQWRPEIEVPPPGQTVKKAWNYWYDLTVTPNPIPPPPIYYKWRQPAQYIRNQGNYWGWDEISVDHNQPLLADDWVCKDDRPITDIHWWGSFPNKDPNESGWIEPTLPPVPPKGFHIGIWSDAPRDPNNQDLTVISHPDEMIWEQYCDINDVDVNFVGFDRDPRDPNHPVRDACFKFSCDLDPNFEQDPCENCIYWLSIAAVYDDVGGYLVVEDFERYANTTALKTVWKTKAPADINAVNDMTCRQIHSGNQAMALKYNNTLSRSEAYADTSGANSLGFGTNWRLQDVRALSLWLHGIADLRGSKSGTDPYTLNGDGSGIYNVKKDVFYYFYREKTGQLTGLVTARVDSIENTDPCAMAGVMMRDTLNDNSIYGATVVTPDNRVIFMYRGSIGQTGLDYGSVSGITMPHWVRIGCVGIPANTIAFHANDVGGHPDKWTQIGTSIPGGLGAQPLYLGLCVTSNSCCEMCTAEFGQVDVNSPVNTRIPDPNAQKDIGNYVYNDPEAMYVVLQDNDSNGIVYYNGKDTTATQKDCNWYEWIIDLNEFSDQGVDPCNIRKMYIGIGDKDNPSSGSGTMYIDDIRLYKKCGGEPDFPWGWKTRPHYGLDDAVRITSTKGDEWPPTVGSQWSGGKPVETPQWFSWDLSFELTTDRDANHPCCP